tara:strand:+ start:16 stop:564 length:549 start_codon:yes stop_codon:yes gene_type:complete
VVKDLIIPSWFSQLNSAQRKESKSSIQLATIATDNTPRVRTVVFRGWSNTYEMQIYSDKRSQKFEELALNNNVEICWLFNKPKSQFRFRGKSSIDLSKKNLRHWDQLSDESKLMWNWPSPGDQFDFDQLEDISVNAKKEISNNFAVLKIEITQVDQLVLSKPIHIRRRWIRKNEWIEERINP